MTEEKLAEVQNPDHSIFTPRERAVLRFAAAMSQNETDNANALFEEMREFFDDAQLVEIGFTIATLHGMNIFNNMFGIEPESHAMESLTGALVQDAAE
tara:strand:+ start:5757 stop:6050 length:294 start_codon:yes stop_codon:yes gene_type:complete